MTLPDASLRDPIEFSETDALLRDDVRRLGALVGQVIAEQESPAFLAEVEALRRAAIARREEGAHVDVLAGTLAGISLPEAEALVRAFTAYFGTTNLAERVHRIRRRRDYQRSGSAPQPGGLEAVVTELRDAGIGYDAFAELLQRLSVVPVFTAHPTEAMRRVLLEKEREVVERLVSDIDRTHTPTERRADMQRILLGLSTAWQTSETPASSPTVTDERAHVGFYLADVLYPVLPVFHEVLAEAIEKAYGQQPVLPPLLRFGTWVGGDMDGNPNVGAATILEALEAQRAQVLANYRRDLRRLSAELSQTVDRIGIAPAVAARIGTYRAMLPEAPLPRARRANMPYRELLGLMGARLHATQAGSDAGYSGPQELHDDLQLISTSLLANHGEHAGRFVVHRVMRRVQAFGFHLAALDLRQDSAWHDAALAALDEDAGWATRSVSARVARLHGWLDGAAMANVETDDATARSTLDVLRAVIEARRRFGTHAIGLYIISMSRSAADALAVLALARSAGCIEDDAVPLDITPLFETVTDLEAAPAVMRALFDDPVYRAHLRTRGDRQTVMLGYSDSAKDGGIIASRWALQCTQVALTALAKESGVSIAFFHGRGGSISRGGSKTERALHAAPRGSVDGSLRVTEQGEVIHRKYGIRALALRNLEQTTAAVLRASLLPRPADPREQRWRMIAGELAASARTRYRALVYEQPRFHAYFRAATPIDVIERLRLGSRPSRRRGGGVEDLRAIPWVFAWSQNRSTMTAWYGVGHALREGLQTHGMGAMREMADHWPFFAVLLDDVEMVLAKSDMAIFEQYSRLAGEDHLELFPTIAEEFNATRDAILAIRQEDDLLVNDGRLRLSIRLRNPYVDPISLLQVELLQRWRNGDREDDATLRALMATVNGIAAGIQNTG